MVDGGSAHHHANLVGAYRTVIKEADGDLDFLHIAIEAERTLRILLVELRLRKVGLHF